MGAIRKMRPPYTDALNPFHIAVATISSPKLTGNITMHTKKTKYSKSLIVLRLSYAYNTTY